MTLSCQYYSEKILVKKTNINYIFINTSSWLFYDVIIEIAQQHHDATFYSTAHMCYFQDTLGDGETKESWQL